MPAKHSAAQHLDREFLEVRCRLIDVAAAMDRIVNASDADAARLDPRYGKLVDAARLLIDGKPDRAERLQMLFSDAYDPNWRL